MEPRRGGERPPEGEGRARPIPAGGAEGRTLRALSPGRAARPAGALPARSRSSRSCGSLTRRRRDPSPSTTRGAVRLLTARTERASPTAARRQETRRAELSVTLWHVAVVSEWQKGLRSGAGCSQRVPSNARSTSARLRGTQRDGAVPEVLSLFLTTFVALFSNVSVSRDPFPSNFTK